MKMSRPQKDDTITTFAIHLGIPCLIPKSIFIEFPHFEVPSLVWALYPEGEDLRMGGCHGWKGKI